MKAVTPNDRLKYWLALIPVVSLLLSVGGGYLGMYGGQKKVEAETQFRLAALEDSSKKAADLEKKLAVVDERLNSVSRAQENCMTLAEGNNFIQGTRGDIADLRNALRNLK